VRQPTKRGYRVGDGVSAPTPLKVINPEFSEAARETGFGGTITLSFIVDKDGNPKDIQVVNPAGLGLEEESVDAVLQWKFRPGQKEARPVNVRIQVETGFRLH
jgi:periplasmic protein TonB